MINSSSKYKAYVAGIKKHITVPITLNGVTYTPADLAKVFQTALDDADKYGGAKADAKAAQAEARASDSVARPVGVYLGAFLRTVYGNDPKLLADFDVVKKTRKKGKVADKVQAISKAKVTRAARHTMGKRQKKLMTSATNGGSSQQKA